jgi:hypothetical protein
MARSWAADGAGIGNAGELRLRGITKEKAQMTKLESDLDKPNCRIEDIAAPVSWLCVDCGVNTAPGLMTRAEMAKAFIVDGKESVAVSLSWNCEAYTVHDAVWAAAGMKLDGGCLCIGCLEKRLGRRLKPKDFQQGSGFNQSPGTPRLVERRSGKRFLDVMVGQDHNGGWCWRTANEYGGPFHTRDEAVKDYAAVGEAAA